MRHFSHHHPRRSEVAVAEINEVVLGLEQGADQIPLGVHSEVVADHSSNNLAGLLVEAAPGDHHRDYKAWLFIIINTKLACLLNCFYYSSCFSFLKSTLFNTPVFIYKSHPNQQSQLLHPNNKNIAWSHSTLLGRRRQHTLKYFGKVPFDQRVVLALQQDKLNGAT